MVERGEERRGNMFVGMFAVWPLGCTPILTFVVLSF